jgi:hypothetical protein
MTAASRIVSTSFWFALIFVLFQDEVIVFLGGLLFLGRAGLWCFRRLSRSDKARIETGEKP